MLKEWNKPEVTMIGVAGTSELRIATGKNTRVRCNLCQVTFANSDAYNKHLVPISETNPEDQQLTCGTNPWNAENFTYVS